MEQFIGFELTKEKKKTPTYVIRTLIYGIATMLMIGGLLAFYICRNEDEKSSGDFMASSGEYREDARLVPYTHMSEGDTLVKLPNAEYKEIKVVHDMPNKKEYIIARKKNADGIISETESNEAFRQLNVEGGRGLIECSFNNLNQEYVVTLCFDNYYKVTSKIAGESVQLTVLDIETEENTVLICGNYESQKLAYDIADRYIENGMDAYVAIPGPEGVSEEEIIDLSDYLSADIFVNVTIDTSGLDDKPVVTGYCNSRYFIPDINSVTLTTNIIDGMARTGVIAVDGVYECDEKDAVSRLKIPATSIVLKCKGRDAYASFIDSEYYDRIVEAFFVNDN